ncbi:MAG: YcfA family protein [Caulobacteraceae bacterium]|nr:YcfA family protein [Caulobacteraceae bacterium]
MRTLQPSEMSHTPPSGAVRSIAQNDLRCIVRTTQRADPIREPTAAGWALDRVRGSQHLFKHGDRPGHVVVPHPKKDLGVGLVAAIRRQAGR